MSPVDIVVEACRAAALAGRPAPTNAALCGLINAKSLATAARVVQLAEVSGLIVVERGLCGRVVEAADGSWRTAGRTGAPHPRYSGSEASKARRRREKRRQASAALRIARPSPSLGQHAERAAAAADPPARQPAATAAGGAIVLPAAAGMACVAVAAGQAAPARRCAEGCRWPLWADRPTHEYCGAPRDSLLGPYCAPDMARAHVRLPGGEP